MTDANSPQIQEIEDLCRAHLENSIVDEGLRETLRPTYKAACKRLIYSSTYYDAVQRPNVKTVIAGVQEIVPEGVIDDHGELHRADVIALATGFNADMFARPIRIQGLGGVDLEALWAERCAAYLGVSLPNFPNLFFLNGPTSPVGNFALIDVAERQWAYIEQLIREIQKPDVQGLCVTDEAFAEHEAARVETSRMTIWASGCLSWYLDKTGVPITWSWNYQRFRELMAEPDLDAYRRLQA